MKNGTIVSIFAFLCIVGSINAQSFSQQVLSSSGNYSTNSGFSISSTTGETSVKTLAGGTIILSQGFQQSYSIISSLTEPKDNIWAISVYPNPTLGMLYINAEDKLISEKFHFNLTDVTGRKIEITILKDWSKNNWQIDMSELANGSYYLNISNENFKTTYTAKVIKVE